MVDKTGPSLAATTAPQSLATSLESVKAVLKTTLKDITKNEVEHVAQHVINPATTILNKMDYSTQHQENSGQKEDPRYQLDIEGR